MMKKIILILLYLPIIVMGQKFPSLSIGDIMPMGNHQMLDVDENKKSLNKLFNDNGLLVVFTCNTCPFVVMWEDRYIQLEEKCSQKKLGMVYINSNHAKRNGDDSMENMKAHFKKMDYNFPYLADDESIVANSFGAKTTPHIYLFNNEKKLVYKGAIDDNYKSIHDVKEKYLIDAIDQLSKKKPIKINQTRAVGCSIKRVKK